VTRISKVKIPNSNINFEVRLTSLIEVSHSLCVLCSKLYNAHQRPAVAAVHSGELMFNLLAANLHDGNAHDLTSSLGLIGNSGSRV